MKQLTINTKLLNETRNVYAALMYAYMQEVQNDGRQVTPDGYFMLTSTEVTDKLAGFTRYQQTTGLDTLRELGLIDVKLIGFPAFRFVKIMPIKREPKTFIPPTFKLEDEIPELPFSELLGAGENNTIEIGGQVLEIPTLE